MASTSISAVTTLITGAVIGAHATTFSSSDTVTIYGPSGEDLDFSTLSIRISNSSTGSAIVAALTVSDDFSDEALGDAALAIASATTVYVGGNDFESSRFKNIATSGTTYAVITFGSAAGCTIQAVQAPSSVTG